MTVFTCRMSRYSMWPGQKGWGFIDLPRGKHILRRQCICIIVGENWWGVIAFSPWEFWLLYQISLAWVLGWCWFQAYNYLQLLWHMSSSWGGDRQISCEVILDLILYHYCTVSHLECLLVICLGRCPGWGGCSSGVVVWWGGVVLIFMEIWVSMVHFCWRPVEMNLVRYLIPHMMCPLRTHPGILVLVGWSGWKWRIQTWFLVYCSL